MKLATDIKKWGFVKPFFDKKYKFNSIDIETIDNELFLLGNVIDGVYSYFEDNFYDNFHELLLKSVRTKSDILTWSRYDNTHLLKLILKNVPKERIDSILLRIGKVTPVYSYFYKNYEITIINIIKDNMIFKINDFKNKSRNVIIYNLKNLYATNLETTAKNYKLDYYSKLGIEYHIIDKTRYNKDSEYKRMVLYSNELDNKVIIDIAKIMIENFKSTTGVYPKTIFTNGSIARSYLLAYKELQVKDLQFKSLFSKSALFDELLNYSMKSYHGGKIESYVLGTIPKANIIDITSAYPFAFKNLPKITDKVWKVNGSQYLERFFYAFIRCDIIIKNSKFIHPIIVRNPINSTNISPYGYIENVIITKVEYNYLIRNGIKIIIHDYIGVEHEEGVYPYEKLINTLFNSRIDNRKINPSLSEMFKTIINSLYGITYELTDIYIEKDDEIKWIGFRAGDYFNPILASYITASIRTYLSEVSYNIIQNGGEIYLNMTDSIIYRGNVTLPVFSEKKILGKFEPPTPLKGVVILGAGRYEYKEEFTKKYVIKNRGFSVEVKDKSFYSNLDLSDKVVLEHRTFVTSFKATTNKYSFEEMGHLIDDEYIINPFNLGGKRVIENYEVNLNKEYTKTRPIKLEKGVLKNE